MEQHLLRYCTTTFNRRFQPSSEYTFTVFLENYARSQNGGKHSQSVPESKEAVVKVPLNKFILESDCLYIGCSPADVLLAAETMASVKHMTLDAILAQISDVLITFVAF